jgi:hypothetical protein
MTMRKRLHHPNLLPVNEAQPIPVQSKSGLRVPIPQVYILMTSKTLARTLPRALWLLTIYQLEELHNDRPHSMSNEESTCGFSKSTLPAARVQRAAPTLRQTSQRAHPSVTMIPETAAGRAIRQAPNTDPSFAHTAGLVPKRAKFIEAGRVQARRTLRLLITARAARRRLSNRRGREFYEFRPTSALLAAPPAIAKAAPPAPRAPPSPSPARTRREYIARRWRRRSSKDGQSGCDARRAGHRPRRGTVGFRPSELIYQTVCQRACRRFGLLDGEGGLDK